MSEPHRPSDRARPAGPSADARAEASAPASLDLPVQGGAEARASASAHAEAEAKAKAEADRRYWRANLRLLSGLLAVWALVSFGFAIAWVEPLNRYFLGGFPLGFWFAQQGAIFTFILLIFVYAYTMDRIEARRRRAERRERRAGQP
jgi:putative solute:sodium symporter small subunit